MKLTLSSLLLCLFLIYSNTSNAQCSAVIGAQFTKQNSTTLVCDSITGRFKNLSTIALADVAYFTWVWGDGSSITGGATSNTNAWRGVSGDSTVSHKYTMDGLFTVSLIIANKTGCIDTFTLKNALSNYTSTHSMSSSKEVYSVSENPIPFAVTGTPSGLSAFLWNFGDPPSGPANFDNQNLMSTEHSYGLGPHLITLRIIKGPCDITLLDTIVIVGPLATIEIPFDRIVQEEVYQCGTHDSVHFTNNSSFYNNDTNPADDDSSITVNGKKTYIFNYTPPSGGGVGTGDQTPIAAKNQNRSMGNQVWRVWDFGDSYAPQCTTSAATGLNVGVNCNFSEDEKPVHLYTNWGDMYIDSFYTPNKPLYETKYNATTNSCYQVAVDTSNKTQHRKIFDKTIPTLYTARLWLCDTVTNSESEDFVLINHTKPDASKMEKISGTPCPYTPGRNNYIHEFKLNTGTQSYFAVNYDSLLFTDFNKFNGGSVLAGPKPGSPYPFVIPYTVQGSYPDEFVKGYTPGQVSNIDRTPVGSFTMGLIVGNGYNASSSQPTCVDTAWYHDLFRITPIETSFSILTESSSTQHICAGNAAYFKLEENIQSELSTLRFNWGYPGGKIARGPQQGGYFERFYYAEPYAGPSPTRNDKNVTYNGQDWYYNYVIRYDISDFNGTKLLDTIVTAIIKDWKIKTEYGNAKESYNQIHSQTIGYSEIPKTEYYKLWGDGSSGCIDTTGLGEFISLTKEEYRTNYGDHVVLRGDRRYRYTNAAHTDSIEVAHVLHFRDSSLQGYDTLIVGTDTTFGVYKHQFVYPVLVNGDTVYKKANGYMYPNVFITNRTGCESRNFKYLNVGFYNEAFVAADVYVNEEFTLLDSIRYYQYGEQDFFTYPIASRDFWGEPNRYVNALEAKSVEWDSANGLTAWNAGFNFKHTYTQTGSYTITLASKDSLNCRDTASLRIYVSERPNIKASFIDSILNPSACNTQVLFTDLSYVIDASCASTICDSVVQWFWDFGNGTTSTNQHPKISVNNTQNLMLNVKLVTWSAKGLKDSVLKAVTIPAGTPISKPGFTYSVNDLSLTTTNTSSVGTSSYIWQWTSGSADTAVNGYHVYSSAANYAVKLTRKDTTSKCESDTIRTIAIGNCNAKFGYIKDTTNTFAITLLDSSSGSSLAYLWNWGDGASSTGATPSHDYTTSGRYLVTLTVTNTNCSSTFSDSLGMDSLGNLLKKDGFTVKVGTASISDLLKSNARIYPNPSEGIVTIQLADDVIQEIEAYSIDGKLQESKWTPVAPNEGKLELNVPAGIYLLLIHSNHGVQKATIEIR
jgi:PKD repeat protein